MASNFVNGINILDTTNSSGVNSGGSLNVRGGASFSKDIYIGGGVNISGTTTAFSDNIILINQNPINSTDTGFLFERFSEDISNNKKYSGIIYSETNDQYVFAYLQNETQRGSVTTNGFIGIQSENLTLNSTQNSTGVGTGGSLNVLGGGSISKDLHIGGNIYNNGNVIAGTSGNVGIGTTSPGYKLHVVGDIFATGEITSSSDVRMKTNIESIDMSEEKIKKINNLRGVLFDRINLIDKNLNHKHVGFVAQELEEAIPELVYTDSKTGYKSIAYGNMTAILLEYIKYLNNTIRNLDTTVQKIDRQLQIEKQEHLQTKQRLDVLETFIQSKFPGEI
jgi:hypothetical protein